MIDKYELFLDKNKRVKLSADEQGNFYAVASGNRIKLGDEGLQAVDQYGVATPIGGGGGIIDSIDNIPITQGVEKDSTNSNVGHSIYIGKNIAQNEPLGTTARNVIIGEDAGSALTTSGSMYRNTLVGWGAARDHTGNFNGMTGIGHGVFQKDYINNTNSYDAGSCTAIGYYAMADYQGADPLADCVAVGSTALTNRNILVEDTAIGTSSGANWTGNPDTAWGFNTSIGAQSLAASSNVIYSIAIGKYAEAFANDLSNCIALGTYALDSSTSVSDSICMGLNTLGYASSVSESVYIGHFSGSSASGMTGMVCVGNRVGSGQSNNQNCTFIGYDSGDAFNFNNKSNATALGYNAIPTASNQITLGNGSITSLRCNVTTISSLSDARDKSNVEDIPLGLDFINALRPVKFDWSRRDGSMQGVKEVGFIAQELDAVQSQFACEEYLKMVDKTDEDRLEASYAQLVPVLVKAIQELKLEIESLKNA